MTPCRPDLRENLAMGPAARILGSKVLKAASTTSLPSHTRLLCLAAFTMQLGTSHLDGASTSKSASYTPRCTSVTWVSCSSFASCTQLTALCSLSSCVSVFGQNLRCSIQDSLCELLCLCSCLNFACEITEDHVLRLSAVVHHAKHIAIETYGCSSCKPPDSK